MKTPITKFIVTYDAGGVFYSHGFVMSQFSYDKSFAHYRALVKIALKDFPFLKTEDIECSVVKDTGYMKDTSFIWFPVPTNCKKEGYDNREKIDFCY